MNQNTDKFSELTASFYNTMPQVNTLPGFFLYSFLTYMFVVFSGWLLNPTMDKILEDDEKSRENRDKGKKMREENMEIRKQVDARNIKKK